jgi:ankyrin repeat protein
MVDQKFRSVIEYVSMLRLKLFALLLLCTTSAVFAAGSADVADAVMRGDQAALRKLLQQKADVNAAQIDGATALHWAVYRDELDTVRLLVKAGATAEAANREGITPLYLASVYGKAAMMETLLKGGANAKQKGPHGETLVMLAARSGNPDAIKLLLHAEADVNAKEPVRGTTALMWAAEQKHPEAVKALLDGGADYAAKSGGAGLPRNYMAQKVNLANVDTAMKRWAEAATNNRTYEQQLAFEEANGKKVTRIQPDFSKDDLASIAKFVGNAAVQFGVGLDTILDFITPQLTAAGRDVDEFERLVRQELADAQAAANNSDTIVAGLVGRGGGGLTAMVFAAREGDLESTKVLVAAGANVNQTTEYGWTPLLTATNNRHYKLAAWLAEHGANVNLPNKGGWTPLYLATDNRNIEGGDYPVPQPDMDHLEFIKVLLKHGANPNLRAKDDTLTRTIFTMQWFFEAGATPFVRAAQSGDTELMRLLLAYGADPHLATDFGDTALTTAAGIGWVEGVTYEHSAAENLAAVKLLLNLGLDPNAANHDGRTPLMGAALKGRSEVVRLLVDHGAILETRDRGSRDTDTNVSKIAGHTWQALDYADGLVRVGVQSAVTHPETATLIRKMMMDRGLTVPPPNRVVDSICIVEICKERQPAIQ